MDDVLASQVAAGEVVERPASVVKELVENSIDSGATAIRVELTRGGIACMKVIDNGKGMSRADLSLCLQRHATSKLLSVDDLFDIRQLGFRGEALPSIASVSHICITTRRSEDVEGWQIGSNGGEEEEIRTAGCPPGTCVEVRDLFFNTPVRRKFLKSQETEAGHIEQQVRLHALAFPDIRFTLLRDGELIFDVAATSDFRQRIAELRGLAPAQDLLRIRPTIGIGVHVQGFLSPLSDARRNRREQYIFLNGRVIEDKLVARAVRDGYGGFPTGMHPSYYLYLDVEPALVDVNVHPAKREVRFRRPAELCSAIIEAIAATLAEHARGNSGECSDATPAPPPVDRPDKTEPSTPLPAPATQPLSHVTRPKVPPAASSSDAPPVLHKLRLITEPTQAELTLQTEKVPDTAGAATDPCPGFRYMGMVRNQFALFENGDGLVILYVRAARERILFERLVESNKRAIPSQRLLAPALVELDARDVGLVVELQPMFNQAGFHVSLFGKQTLRIESIPAFLPLQKVESFIEELISLFSVGETRANRNRDPFELFAIRLANQYAHKEDLTPWLRDPVSLLRDLLHCEIPYCTPRGKPTMIPFSFSEIQRRFQAQ